MRIIINPSPLKGSLYSFVMILCLLFSTSCSKTTVVFKPKKQTTKVEAKKVPPGQAKKATGSKSAKAYAPGQQKKKVQK
jgi:hypothetical protein